MRFSVCFQKMPRASKGRARHLVPSLAPSRMSSIAATQPETANAVLIAITGYGQDGDRGRALAAGFDLHLVKPVDTAKLAAILAEVA